MVALTPEPTTLAKAFKRLAEIADTDLTALTDDRLGVIIDELNDIASHCEIVFEMGDWTLR